MSMAMTDRSKLIFAVDGGASKTHARLYGARPFPLASTHGGPCNLHQDPARAMLSVQAAWRACCAVAGLNPASTAARTTISAGLAGVSDPDARARFHAGCGGFAGRLVSGDGYVALVGAFKAEPGALISVGTGVVGCRFDAAGGHAQLGGWGFPVGDAGGGAWIGLRAVGAWLDHLDGVAKLPAAAGLWEALAGAIGTGRAAILPHLRGAAPQFYAALAPLVVREAEAGCAFADDLLEQAALHLAALARALDAERLALSGGLAATMAPRLQRLHPRGEILLQPPMTDWALEGARLIARGVRPAEYAG
jgi:glucosamine kinase